MLPYINTPFDSVASSLGASTDELKLIFSFLLSYPLAGLLKRIPDKRPDLKNAYIIAVSLFYLVGLFDLWAGIRTLIISSSAAYLISAYMTGPYMPWIGFFFLMGHMSINHINRHYINNPSAVDITGAQMVLIMKLTAFCWNVHDGRLPDNQTSDFQRDHMIKEMPSLLDYAGYVLFFPSLFAGPAFDYVEYRAWLECTMFALPPGVSPDKAPPTRKKRKIPRSGTPAMLKAAAGLAWLFAYLKFSSWYTTESILGPRFLEYWLPRRVFMLHMLGFATRMKYYAVWSLTEGACILSGIGYAGVDPVSGKADWSRLTNVHPLGIELAQNTRAYLGNWNINTNVWLRNCMYLRVTPRGKKPGFRASMATFVTSAFWHGFEPGYYMAFVLAAFNQTVAKNARRFFRPFVIEAGEGKKGGSWKRVYDVASWVVTQLAFSFTVAPFIMLSFEASISTWARVYFYAIIGVAGSMAFFASPGKVWLKRKIERRNVKAAGGKPSTDGAVDGHAKRPAAFRTESSAKEPLAGLPDDPGRELDEMMDEIRAEVEMRRQKGMSVGDGLQEATEAVQKKWREAGKDVKVP